jgi:hypothetical protein
MQEQLTIGERSELARAEQRIEEGLKTFVDVANAFIEIRDHNLWREDYDSWESYCRVKWHITPRRVNQLLDAHAVVAQLPEDVAAMVTTERAARELASIPEPERAEVVHWAADEYKEITSASIRKAKDDNRYVLNPLAGLVDETGFPLSPLATVMFNRRVEIERVLMEVRRLRDFLMRLDSRDTLWQALNRQGTENTLHDLNSRISACLPYAVCYQCQGKPSLQPGGKCVVCLNRGVLNKAAYEIQCPEEIKSIRHSVAKAYEAEIKAKRSE